jgi:hypothetical protein
MLEIQPISVFIGSVGCFLSSLRPFGENRAAGLPFHLVHSALVFAYGKKKLTK